MKINIYAMLRTLLFSIENGKNITSGIELLSKNTKSKKEKRIYDEIANDLKEGTTFSQSLSKHKVGSIDAVHFIAMAEKGVSLKTALKKILNYLKVKDEFQRESNEKISLPFIYFTLASFVVIGVKFIAVPMQIEKASQYSKEIIDIIAGHLDVAILMTNILFISLLVVAGYFLSTLLALFSESRNMQKICKNIALKLPFTNKIIIKFEKFVIFSMLGEMLQSGIPYKKAIQSAIETTNITHMKKAFKESLESIRTEGKFILHSKLFEGIEQDLLTGVGSSHQIGTVLSEISNRAREDALSLTTKFFRIIILCSILLMTFAVFIEFYTVVLTQILIQKGLIDSVKGGIF